MCRFDVPRVTRAYRRAEQVTVLIVALVLLAYTIISKCP